MRLIIFGLGIASAAVGFITIGFGIAPSALNFGNFLIVAGTVAVVGGFILIALSSVVGLLQRIAQGDIMHAPVAPFHLTETFQSRAQPPLPGVAPSPIKSEAAPRAQAAPDLPLAAAPVSEPDLAWLRPKTTAPSFGEQTMIAEMEASLPPASPAPPPQPSAPRLVSPMPSMPSPPPANRPSEPEVHPMSRAESIRPAPPVEHPNPSGLFDTVWPEIRPARNAETVARARKPDVPAPPDVKARDTHSESQAPPEDQRPAILKSGMIDGMAYTLFADGSIEAVLATGPIRFASIDALRLHLE
jgi:hypothetical protein